MQPCNGLISSFQSCMKQTCPCSYFRAAHCDFLLSFAANLQKTVTKMLLTCVSGWVTRSRAEVKWDLEIGPLLWHEKLLQLARTRRSAAGEHPDLLTERCNAPPPLIAAGSVCHVQGAAGVAFFFADEIRSQGTFPSLVITIPLLLKTPPPPLCLCETMWLCRHMWECGCVGEKRQMEGVWKQAREEDKGRYRDVHAFLLMVGSCHMFLHIRSKMPHMPIYERPQIKATVGKGMTEKHNIHVARICNASVSVCLNSLAVG